MSKQYILPNATYEMSRELQDAVYTRLQKTAPALVTVRDWAEIKVTPNMWEDNATMESHVSVVIQVVDLHGQELFCKSNGFTMSAMEHTMMQHAAYMQRIAILVSALVDDVAATLLIVRDAYKEYANAREDLVSRAALSEAQNSPGLPRGRMDMSMRFGAMDVRDNWFYLHGLKQRQNKIRAEAEAAEDGNTGG